MCLFLYNQKIPHRNAGFSLTSKTLLDIGVTYVSRMPPRDTV